jgi:tetratricopeptide (TPR) repeat protein
MKDTNQDMKPAPQREEALFQAAAQLDGAARAAFLDNACRGDAGLRTRLEALNQPLSQTNADGDAPHMCSVAHGLVSACQMELNQPAEALTNFLQSQQWDKILIEQEPGNARYARDWSEDYSHVGSALIALEGYEEGMANLQEAVRLAENLVARDPLNGFSQLMLIDNLQEQANGFAQIARARATTPARQAECWRQAIQSLTRCQDLLASPELQRIRSQFGQTSKEIAQQIDEARASLAKLLGDAETKPTKP